MEIFKILFDISVFLKKGKKTTQLTLQSSLTLIICQSPY